MKTSQYLRFVPNNPVLFSYNSKNDSLPNVIVLNLLHEEDNPGFFGINLNYVEPDKKEYLLRTIQIERNTNLMYNMGEYKLAPHLQALCKGALRRYNYDMIGKFFYRGAKQNHQK